MGRHTPHSRTAKPPAQRQKHKCPHCTKTYTRLYDLEKHVAGVHQKPKSIRCGPCQKNFCGQEAYDTHVHKAYHKQWATIRYFREVPPSANYAAIPEIGKDNRTLPPVARNRNKGEVKTSEALSIFGFGNNPFLRKTARGNVAYPEGENDSEDEQFAKVDPPIRAPLKKTKTEKPREEEMDEPWAKAMERVNKRFNPKVGKKGKNGTSKVQHSLKYAPNADQLKTLPRIRKRRMEEGEVREERGVVVYGRRG
ncbi:hypothetical protein FKW77_008379 [Venturia effusa]|uniref:C2H2-type domain-containing protein n=1 Tax=Venturia effusa TaxID=50376 RepID=A0A517L9S3_9PEZI|nr:hypothetical protein FKW77_008379 [Venturia effusa]